MSKTISEERRKLIEEKIQPNKSGSLSALASIDNFTDEEISYIVERVKDREDLTTFSLFKIAVNESHYKLMIQLLKTSNYITTICISELRGSQTQAFFSKFQHEDCKEFIQAVKVKNILSNLVIQIGPLDICHILQGNLRIQSITWEYPQNTLWSEKYLRKIQEFLENNTSLTNFNLKNVPIGVEDSCILQNLILRNKMLKLDEEGKMTLLNTKFPFTPKQLRFIAEKCSENNNIKQLSVFWTSSSQLILASRIIMSRSGEPIALELNCGDAEDLDTNFAFMFKKFCALLNKTEKVYKVSSSSITVVSSAVKEFSKKLTKVIQSNKNIYGNRTQPSEMLMGLDFQPLAPSRNVKKEFQNHVKEAYEALSKKSPVELTKPEKAQIIILGKIFADKLLNYDCKNKDYFTKSAIELEQRFPELYMNIISICFKEKAAPLLQLGFPLDVIKEIESHLTPKNITDEQYKKTQLIEYKAITHNFGFQKAQGDPNKLKGFLLEFKKRNKDADQIIGKFIEYYSKDLSVMQLDIVFSIFPTVMHYKIAEAATIHEQRGFITLSDANLRQLTSNMPKLAIFIKSSVFAETFLSLFPDPVDQSAEKTIKEIAGIKDEVHENTSSQLMNPFAAIQKFFLSRK